MRNHPLLFGFAALLGCLCPLRAQMTLPSIFSDHLMLQADSPARIWGTTSPSQQVSVSFRDATVSVTADAAGYWQLWLPVQKSGTQGTLVIRSGSETRTVNDVLFGEVWLAAGQSNMERSLHFSQDREKVAARAAKAGFRFFVVAHSIKDAPAADAAGQWEIADAKDVDHFSATATSFAIEFSERRHRPVGIIDSSFGGTRLQAWTSAEALTSDSRLAYIGQAWDKNLETLVEQHEAYLQATAKWEASLSPEDRKKADAGVALPGKPGEPLGPGSKLQPSGLYNGMIAPITPFTVRGILWYQGENDADLVTGYAYRYLFRVMIESWRKAWGDETLPFIFVQLSRYHSAAYPLLRESQEKALALAHTAMVVSIDQGTSEDVHYPDKEVVGARLERAAEALAYDVPGSYVPLQPARLTVEGDALHVWFSPQGVPAQVHTVAVPYFAAATDGDADVPHVVDGRVIRSRQPTAEEVQMAAQVAGADGVFSPATVGIDGNSVVFRSAVVSHPTQVCYAWSDATPAVLLWGPGELPVTPFRMALDSAAEPACPMTKH